MTSIRVAFPTLAALLLLPLVSTGCMPDEDPGGAEEVGEPDPDEGETQEPGCSETVHVLADLDAETPEGHSAGEMLDPRVGVYVSELSWLDPHEQPVKVDVQPPAPLTQLDLGLDYLDGELRYIEAVAEGSDAEQAELAADCKPRLEADVVVRIESQDGALIEELHAILAADIDEAGLGVPRIRHELDMEAMVGSLAIASIEPADPSAFGLELIIDWPIDEQDISIVPRGRLGGWAEYHSGEGLDAVVSMAEFSLAVFGGWDEGE